MLKGILMIKLKRFYNKRFKRYLASFWHLIKIKPVTYLWGNTAATVMSVQLTGNQFRQRCRWLAYMGCSQQMLSEKSVLLVSCWVRWPCRQLAWENWTRPTFNRTICTTIAGMYIYVSIIILKHFGRFLQIFWQ